MACQYYIKKTNNPRICSKKVPPTNNFLWECWLPGYKFHYCNQHFKMVQTKIITQIEGIGAKDLQNQPVSCFYNLISKWDEYKKAQMASILQTQTQKDKIDDGVRNEEKVPSLSQECPICLESFKNNIIFLECAHPICNGCLRKLQRRRSANQQCPICRHPF